MKENFTPQDARNMFNELFQMMAEKYHKGSIEHKSETLTHLTPKELVQNALEEAIDGCFYLYVLLKKM